MKSYYLLENIVRAHVPKHLIITLKIIRYKNNATSNNTLKVMCSKVVWFFIIKIK